jgi:septum formation inhibitor-activating ATPase MinD
VVLNRATMQAGVGRRDIEDRLGVQIKHRIPDDQPAATHSINRGVPLILNYPRGAVTRAIHKLTRRIMDDLPSEDLQEPRSSLLRRWLPSPRSAHP